MLVFHQAGKEPGDIFSYIYLGYNHQIRNRSTAVGLLVFVNVSVKKLKRVRELNEKSIEIVLSKKI